jgi:hypothetical protein
LSARLDFPPTDWFFLGAEAAADWAELPLTPAGELDAGTDM